ncbi:MAG: hypothetical protein V2I46_07590 [Bacteroides sp.]|jgi:hypothetical protein|nr:hypothetical protein [Bacteroides sp.]
MKRILLLSLGLVYCLAILAQPFTGSQAASQAMPPEKTASVPTTIDFQGHLTDTEGNPLNLSITMTFNLYDVETGGTALWSEAQLVQISDGLFQVRLGASNPLDPGLFSSADRWLGIQVGAEAEMSPRTKFSSAGFALHAEEADPSWTGSTNPNDPLGRMGRVGIGTNDPDALLHTYGTGTGQGNVVFEGAFKTASPGDPPLSGSGTRLMWYPDKAAFRAGAIQGSQWDAANTGLFSTAMGLSTTASADYSTALGSNTFASGSKSIAAGSHSRAKGACSMAMGDSAVAAGGFSTAFGRHTLAGEFYSTAMGMETSALGSGSTAMGGFTNASGSYSTAMGSYTTASGASSVAMGAHTNATAPSATAMGYQTTASGNYATALGSTTTASGVYATALGFQTTASGVGALAMGQNTTAPSYGETAGGTFNTLYTPAGVTSWEEADRLFVIGNGTSDAGRSNALTILKNGHLGLGTDSPLALLHAEGMGTGKGNVVFVGEYNLESPAPPPISGAGTRLMWYPDKAAFRAGSVNDNQWDMESIGPFSVALGRRNTASGYGSLATGVSTIASGDRSTAIGEFTVASGNGSTAMGDQATASGSVSTAMGFKTTASGNASTAMGDNTTASSKASLAVGKYNIGGGTPGLWVETDPLFEIGIGDFETPENALTVLKNGNVGLGTHTPEALLHAEGMGTGEGNVVFVGNIKDTPGGPPVSGTGTRMMWYPDKAAFRAGFVDGDQWDQGNIGNNSSAMGINALASGLCSIAMGDGAAARGAHSTAMGHNTTAYATSTAMGCSTLSNGLFTTAMGYFTKSSSKYSTALGIYNIGGGNPLDWVQTDPLFEIGNGTSEGTRNNALTVLKNGNVGIGTATPAYRLDVYGNSRIQLTKGNGAWMALRTDGTMLDFSFTGHPLAIQGAADGENILLNPIKANKVGIRTWSPVYDLDVNGNIRATGSVYYGGTEGTANGTPYTKPDYVFEESYETLGPDQVEAFLLREKHLPWITSAEQERQENGGVIDMTRMAFETLESVENLQLQLIRQYKLVRELKAENDALNARLERLESALESLSER